jgi:hypothetical protein
MGLAALALILPGLVFDGAGAAPAGGAVNGLQETTVRYGPFVLPPAGKGGDVDHANVFMPNVAKPCEDCFITRAEPDLVYADGTSANLDTGLMLHHAVFFNTGRPDTTCGKDTFFGRMGERFLASGNERTIKRMPEGYGYHLGRDPVTGVFHIMNHSDETKTVYMTFKVSWLPGSTPGIRPVTPVWLDINNCRTSEYAVPAGTGRGRPRSRAASSRRAGTSTPAACAPRCRTRRPGSGSAPRGPVTERSPPTWARSSR